ncbi:MAG: BMP family ABC transporter substrate-binding protein [Caldilineaceae bacterium]|nr:BMP family ABC transporter substrate-binding protein [Caldilineaceae bacterium]
MKASRPMKLLVLLTALALLLAACPAPMPATDSDSGAADTADGMAGAFKVGLVTDVGRVNDRSFNQSAWEGVVAAAEALGLAEDDIKYIETQDAKDYADNMQQFIDADYNVIVSVGFALGDATTAAAQENPDVFFIGVDQFQGEAMPNLAGLIFNEDHSGYLAGVLAGSLSKTGTIAAVLGTDLVPPVVAFNEGYIAGAKSVNADINVISTYHPGEISQAFVDPEWGAATAKQALDQGADVIFGAGGITGNGALQEIATADGAGEAVFCIGVDTDQWNTVPAAQPCLVSSAMKLITPGVVELVTMASEGEFPGGNYFGDADLAPFHDFDDMISQELKDLLEETKAGLIDGSIDTGYGN